MKKIHKKELHRLVASIAATMLFTLLLSCTDEERAKPQVEQDIQVVNGYLHFKDQQSFEAARIQLSTLSQDLLNSWEKQMPGFVSQRSILNVAIEEELRHGETAATGNPGAHSDFATRNNDVLNFDSEGSVHLNLPITEEGISTFVNRKGLVKVGQKLFKYDRNSIKVIMDGDENKLSLLHSINESNKDHGILVYNVSVEEIDLEIKDGRTAFYGDASCTGYTSGGGQRVRGKVYKGCTAVVDVYGDYGYPGSIVTQTTVVAEAINEIKNIFGWSRKTTHQLGIEGTVVTNIGGTIFVNSTTSGNSASILTRYLYISNWYPQQCGTNPITYSGNLAFRGRDGSNCSF